MVGAYLDYNATAPVKPAAKAYSDISWDTYFFSFLPIIASKSKLPVKVGALAVGPYNEVRLTGFNGLPSGVKDLPERLEFPLAYKWGEHAERNLIYFAARIGISLNGCKLYMPSSPCVDCARAIIGAGFIEVISDGDGVYNRTQRYKEKGVEAYTEYKEDHKIVINMFEDKGIPWRIHYGAL